MAKTNGKQNGRKLTARQKAFCIHYIESNNATQAAIKAGYASLNARITGCKNLTKDNVKVELSRLYKIHVQKDDYDAAKIRQTFIDIMNDAVAAGDRPNALRAGEDLAKIEGMFLERRHIRHEGTVPVELGWEGDDDETES